MDSFLFLIKFQASQESTDKNGQQRKSVKKEAQFLIKIFWRFNHTIEHDHHNQTTFAFSIYSNRIFGVFDVALINLSHKMHTTLCAQFIHVVYFTRFESSRKCQTCYEINEFPGNMPELKWLFYLYCLKFFASQLPWPSRYLGIVWKCKLN